MYMPFLNPSFQRIFVHIWWELFANSAPIAWPVWLNKIQELHWFDICNHICKITFNIEFTLLIHYALLKTPVFCVKSLHVDGVVSVSLRTQLCARMRAFLSWNMLREINLLIDRLYLCVVLWRNRTAETGIEQKNHNGNLSRTIHIIKSRTIWWISLSVAVELICVKDFKRISLFYSCE